MQWVSLALNNQDVMEFNFIRLETCLNLWRKGTEKAKVLGEKKRKSLSSPLEKKERERAAVEGVGRARGLFTIPTLN